MTAKEAIRELRFLKPKDQDYAFGGLSNASGLAVEMAIQALEKQIPKKPDAEEDRIAGCASEVCLMCPSCGSFIGYATDCEDEHYQIPYCQGCGQAIDWGKEEECRLKK